MGFSPGPTASQRMVDDNHAALVSVVFVFSEVASAQQACAPCFQVAEAHIPFRQVIAFSR